MNHLRYYFCSHHWLDRLVYFTSLRVALTVVNAYAAISKRSTVPISHAAAPISHAVAPISHAVAPISHAAVPINPMNRAVVPMNHAVQLYQNLF